MTYGEEERRLEEQEAQDELRAWNTARSYDEYRERVGHNRPPILLRGETYCEHGKHRSEECEDCHQSVNEPKEDSCHTE